MSLNKYFPENLSLRENVLVLRTSIVPSHESTGFEHNEYFSIPGIRKTFAKVELYFLRYHDNHKAPLSLISNDGYLLAENGCTVL